MPMTSLFHFRFTKAHLRYSTFQTILAGVAKFDEHFDHKKETESIDFNSTCFVVITSNFFIWPKQQPRYQLKVVEIYGTNSVSAGR